MYCHGFKREVLPELKFAGRLVRHVPLHLGNPAKHLQADGWVAHEILYLVGQKQPCRGVTCQ